MSLKETRLDYLAKGGYRSGRTIKEDGEILNLADFFGRMDMAMTTFNELSVAESTSIIDLKACFPLSKKRDKVTVTGSATATQENGYFLIQTTASGTDSIVFESVERGDYVAGLESVAGNALQVLDRPTGTSEVEWGYTDFNDGFVWGEDASGMFIRLYSGGLMVKEVRRASWDDQLSANLDPSDLNVYRNPFDYYGQGPIKFHTVIGRAMYLAHVLENPNTDGPIFEQPNLPLNLRIKNNGTASAIRVKLVGRQYIVKGRIDTQPRQSSEVRIAQTVSTTFVPLVSWRQKLGDYDAVNAALNAIVIMSDTNLIYQVRSYATLTGAVWAEMTFSESGVESALEWDKSATAISGGMKEFESLAVGGTGATSTVRKDDLPASRMPNGQVVVSLCARTTTGTGTVTSCLKAEELW